MLKTDLKDAIFDSVEHSTGNSGKLGIAFSGGIDSTLLAGVCKNLGLSPILLTVGFPNSYDIQHSKLISSKIKMTHAILEITAIDFLQICQRILQKTQCRNISHIENCIAFYFVGKLAFEWGINTVLTANGFDELFCGYDRYRSIYNDGPSSINDAIKERLAKERELIMEVNHATGELAVSFRQPFLSEEFISTAMNIPVTYKIIGQDDHLRKHILRKLALSLELPDESILAKKKAIQYSSLIHRNYKQFR